MNIKKNDFYCDDSDRDVDGDINPGTYPVRAMHIKGLSLAA
jgi:hypothetical protein